MAYYLTVLRPPGSPHEVSREMVAALLDAWNCVAGPEGEETYRFYDSDEDTLFEVRLRLFEAEGVLGPEEPGAEITIRVPDARLSRVADTAFSLAFDLADHLGWLVFDEQRGEVVQPEETDAIVATLTDAGSWSEDEAEENDEFEEDEAEEREDEDEEDRP